MKLYLVERPNGKVVVAILRNKSDNTYSYVNLTKGHICPCRFVSEEEALYDMDQKIKSGEILRYILLNFKRVIFMALSLLFLRKNGV